MLRKLTDIKQGLRGLGLNDDEIEVYLALLHSSASPLILSQKTGIKRTKVYSLLATLEKRSLIVRMANEDGSLFGVTDPVNLGIQIDELEAKLKDRQKTFHQIIPMLNAMRGVDQVSSFAVRIYEGEEGFKQMLWHELKAKGELLSLGGGDIEELIDSKAWVKQYRERVVEAGYNIREIINSEIDLPTPIDSSEYLQHYHCRGISVSVAPLEDQTTIYNDTVAIYNWRQRKKIGTEIVSKTFTNTMRAVFDSFWTSTGPTNQRRAKYPDF
jgi:predicted transcriptional regulator